MGIQQQSIFKRLHVPTGVAALFAALTLAVGLTTNIFAASTVVVHPGDMQGWTDGSAGGGSASIVDDAPAGLGESSLELTTGSDNADRAAYAKTVNVPLADISELSYYTKRVAASSAGGNASYIVGVDLDGGGGWDTNLVYEPYWQDGGNLDAAPVVNGEWQQWDVDSGLFWSSRSYDGTTLGLEAGAGGPPFYALAQLQEAFPDAEVTGIGVNVGTYNPNYTIRVDGVSFNGTVYDFEAEPEATVATSKDECKSGGWQSLVRADGTSFKNQGQCVAYVASSGNSRHHR